MRPQDCSCAFLYLGFMGFASRPGVPPNRPRFVARQAWHATGRAPVYHRCLRIGARIGSIASRRPAPAYSSLSIGFRVACPIGHRCRVVWIEERARYYGRRLELSKEFKSLLLNTAVQSMPRNMNLKRKVVLVTGDDQARERLRMLSMRLTGLALLQPKNRH